MRIDCMRKVMNLVLFFVVGIFMLGGFNGI